MGRDPIGLLRLGDDECWAFLAKHSLGRVGLIHMGNPLVFPVNYAVDGHSIVFRTAPGTKLAMAANAQLAVFEVDEASELFETGTSVMVHGTMHGVTDPGERARLARMPLRVWAPGERDHFVRVEPKWMSGRSILTHQLDEGLVADGG
jgi:nitroimidazol reductase NimA-like FMN-containing flavoprotein (pyridoxamine 5'-phosphate oxidase superfamily)